MSDPWAEISPSASPEIDNVRRASPDHPLDFRFGKDFQGRCLFILDGAMPRPEKRTLPSIEGLDMVLGSPARGAFQLRLTLLDRTDAGLFNALATDLLSLTGRVEPHQSHRGLQLVIDRLARWQRLFRRKRTGLLTPAEVIGLAGELVFLRDCVLTRIGALEALAAWRGPYGDEQDVLINSVIFEVKTQLATSDARVLVSSENQLDTSSGEIVIVHQRMSPASAASPGKFTLNSLVSDLRTSVGAEGVARDTLEIGLAEYGFLDRRDYDDPAWILATRSFYKVGPGFPSLRPIDLPPGVSNVRYAISISACASFLTDGDALMSRVIDGRD